MPPLHILLTTITLPCLGTDVYCSPLASGLTKKGSRFI